MTATTDERVDRPAFVDLLKRIESDLHRDGWDRPAQVFLIYGWDETGTNAFFRAHFSRRCGRPVRSRPYAAHPIAPPEAMREPASMLYVFANNLRHYVAGSLSPRFADGMVAVADVLRQPGIVGVAFCCETWAHRTVGPDAQQKMEQLTSAGATSLADIPGSVEQRLITGVDITGGVHFVVRERGSKPRTEMIEGHEINDSTVLGGAVIESLRLIMAFVDGRPMTEPEYLPRRWDQFVEKSNRP